MTFTFCILDWLSNSMHCYTFHVDSSSLRLDGFKNLNTLNDFVWQRIVNVASGILGQVSDNITAD